MTVRYDFTLLDDGDIALFQAGRHPRLAEKLGAHLTNHSDEDGTCFGLWAPNARGVSIIGDFNGWEPSAHPLESRGSGIWEGFVPRVGRGERYKFHINSREGDYWVDKADPFGFFFETPPATASIVWDLDYAWGDGDWMASRQERNSLQAPISVYEVHLGSWMRDPSDPARLLGYREIAPRLAEHVRKTGFTHVELLPLMEHPFYGSWGYQVTGFFAPTSRFGAPQDLMYLIDHLHQQDIGVILDWVPSNFPTDEHGLGYFDGTHLFEPEDPRRGFHPDWNSFIFDYGRGEVRSFLISSALHWLSTYHADGLRVDGVASMLYLDYSRAEGEWIPNEYGGNENLEAVSLFRNLNEIAYAEIPEVQTIAEESTSWPMVTRPVYLGGLGFGLKWDMGWMHDTLEYGSKDPLDRKGYHDLLTFRAMYMFSENYILPLSHDEVVYGKGSLLTKMPGDEWHKFANLRLLLGQMWAQPGKKLLFMGGEFGQWEEWRHDAGLAWHLLEDARHEGVRRWVEDLNRVYRSEPAMHTFDCDPRGFEWINPDHRDWSIISYLRKGDDDKDLVLVVCNFTPVPRLNYPVGVPVGGTWREVLNSDATEYGGSGVGNLGGKKAAPVSSHGRPRTLTLNLPPLGCLLLKPETSEA
jgi:1,4-alpha-glucan branching enzyme